MDFFWYERMETNRQRREQEIHEAALLRLGRLDRPLWRHENDQEGVRLIWQMLTSRWPRTVSISFRSSSTRTTRTTMPAAAISSGHMSCSGAGCSNEGC